MEDIQHPLVHTLPTPSVFMIWRETVGILHRQLLWQTMVLSRGGACYAVRGGSWYATSRSCTLSYRGEGRKDSASSTVGFRIAADYTPADGNN